MHEWRIRARERLAGICRLCKVCDGRACAGEVPGFGGVGTGASFINNVEALRRIKINMRTLHPVSQPCTQTALFGIDLSTPVLGAAVGGASINMKGIITEDDLAWAMISGSARAGSLGMGGDGGHEEVLESTLKSIKNCSKKGIPVIKPRLQGELLRRIRLAEDAGAPAVAIDVDAAGLVNMALLGQAVEPKDPRQISEIVQSTPLPVVLKGIMTPDEALLAAECGCSGIVVSNHGGRGIDHCPGTASVLRDIASAVRGKLVVMVDGGIRSGVDVLKMLALGADFCLVGRPLAQAAVGGGEEAVAEEIKRITSELRVAMIMTGQSHVHKVSPNVIHEPESGIAPGLWISC
ncbi:MAG: alpha-hydroxy-acid oxidizing protein [Bacillota bacterium]